MIPDHGIVVIFEIRQFILPLNENNVENKNGKVRSRLEIQVDFRFVRERQGMRKNLQN